MSGIFSVEQARKIVEERGLSHVKVGVFDLDGVMRGKYMSRAKFFAALEGGFNFCDVVLGWDSNDQLYDNVTHTGWHTGYPDATVRLLPESCRDLMYEEGGLFFLAEFSGASEALCPRAMLRRVIEYSRSLGFEPFSAVEYEFFVFSETPKSAQAKGYRNLEPWTPGNFGYSVLRNSVQNEFYQELLRLGEVMDFPIEGLHNETGPGVLEVAIGVDGSLASADKAALFKTFAKVCAQRNSLMATFMAKWSNDYPGQSGHLHMSLQKDGQGVFFQEGKPHGMSDLMRHFTAGCQHYMPQVLAMVASTVNSYSRLVPGYWAPTNATWGVENRTCALRAIPGSAKSQRLEYRVAGADANPYLALAAALASGLWGIEEKLEPNQPIQGNAYTQQQPPELELPHTLWSAAQNLKASQRARELFGDAFVDHFAATREWEERELRKTITDWELRRYFEII
ncbi:MAG: glutamine synthetase [Candidatus Eremiobacteraeota bacterium]|nr:glutamine synthetase [Candidatus Eremiobacteraeota bacterium]MCW5869736.1 glutamine synthetase [Candidatus Eremiobacteraeota bacterium]